MSLVASEPDDHTGLKPPQFSLRTLLIIVTLLGGLFAVMATIGVMWSAILGLFLILAAAHVVGNALGTTLRDHSDRSLVVSIARTTPARPNIEAGKQLTQKIALAKITRTMTILGALLGAILGSVAMSIVMWEHINWGGMALGVFSAGVLGGFAGFLGSSFFTIARGAWREALEEEREKREKRTAISRQQSAQPKRNEP